MKKLLFTLAVAAFLAGCAQIVKVGPGEVLVGNRLAVQADAAWNQFANAPGGGPQTVWTIDGTPLDALQFFVGLKDGALIAPQPKDTRPLQFKAAMQPHELTSLVQGLFSQDGSAVTMGKVEPVEFLGGSGTRMEFSVLRKIDDVNLRGVAWVAVRDNQLFALTFTAPRLGFFPRHQARVEQLVRTLKLKS